MQYRAHPWHGVSYGAKAPTEVQVYVEIVQTDTVKYEVDKDTGFLKVDRPQLYSNCCPTLYGFIPRTLCGENFGAHCCKKTGKSGLTGDNDPLDICILSERPIVRGDILITAIPVGGFRMIDNGEFDDKIVAVMKGDLGYGHITDISRVPVGYIQRLKHYFLTYKLCPEEKAGCSPCEIVDVYDQKEAYDVIRLSIKDYSVLY